MLLRLICGLFFDQGEKKGVDYLLLVGLQGGKKKHLVLRAQGAFLKYYYYYSRFNFKMMKSFLFLFFLE